MTLASVNAAITPGRMALKGWRTGRRRKERVSSCGSVWGRITPPPDKEFVGGGGGLFWAFEDNDGDSQQSLPTGWLWKDGGWGGEGRKGSRHVVLCGAGLPSLLTKSLLGGGGLFWAFEDNDGWLHGGSCRGPLLVHPGKGCKIPKSPAG